MPSADFPPEFTVTVRASTPADVSIEVVITVPATVDGGPDMVAAAQRAVAEAWAALDAARPGLLPARTPEPL